MLREETAHPTAGVVERLRNLRYFLPHMPKILYMFAAYLADSMAGYKQLYPSAICGSATGALTALRFGGSWDYLPIPTKLSGRRVDSYFFLFDSIPQIFSAITVGELEKGILDTFREIRSNAAERLDHLDDARTMFQAARSRTGFSIDQLEYVDLICETKYEVKDTEMLPPYLWTSDLCGFKPLEATHFIPLVPGPHQWLWAVAWLRPVMKKSQEKMDYASVVPN